MSLESKLFKRDYYYNVKQVERYVEIIKTDVNAKRVSAFKNLVFRMMKDIVKKNITNYLNLLSGSSVLDIPERDELVAECYIAFDKCLEKYLVNHGYNFYFYLNKSLSRKFFRDYKRETKRSNDTTEITEVMNVVEVTMRTKGVAGTTNLVMSTLHFTELEMAIGESKLNGENADTFLKKHPDVTAAAYSKALREIRRKLSEAKENNDI